jgi:hypothetical protein
MKIGRGEERNGENPTASIVVMVSPIVPRH